MSPLSSVSSKPGRVRMGLQVVLVRLRFVLMLIAILGIIASWDALCSWWDRLAGPTPSEGAVSIDTEYWCPMCPGIVSSWPGKCPVCNMALLRRKKAEPVPLPDGTLTRMQISPARLQLAGVRTTPIDYQPLHRDILLAGFVHGRTRLQAELSERDLPFLEVGQKITATSDLLPGHCFTGKIESLGPYLAGQGRSLAVEMEVDDPQRQLRPGMLLNVQVSVPAARRPWSGRAVTEEWRDRLSVELLAHALAAPAGPVCPGGLETLVRMAGAQAMHRADRMLAVPETAVVDTGSRKVVYVESGPGMFDGVEVVLGPRCGDSYPVLRGLEAGQRVVAAGAFLVDAETRLNQGVAAAYFGATRASGTPSAKADSSVVISTELSAADRALAEKQKTCPVTGEPLDSMGGPVRVVIEGRTVFLCCKGCEPALRKNPGKYLGKLPPASGR